LSLEHLLELLVGLFLLGFVLFLEDLVLLLSFDAVLLDDVVVVVGALEGGLHLCELMLDSVELDTDLFSVFLDLLALLVLGYVYISNFLPSL
jgi:hypothetical protein